MHIEKRGVRRIQGTKSKRYRTIHDARHKPVKGRSGRCKRRNKGIVREESPRMNEDIERRV